MQNVKYNYSYRPRLSQVSYYDIHSFKYRIIEKVRGGSMLLNHTELVYEHPAHRVSSVKM